MITVGKKMPPQSAMLPAVSLRVCRLTRLILPSRRQSHYCFPYKALNPVNWADSGVWACFSQTPTVPVPPLLPPRVQSQPCISNITAWTRVPLVQALDSVLSSPPWSNVTGRPTAAVDQQSLQPATVSDTISDLAAHRSPVQACQGPAKDCAQCSAPLPSLQREQARKKETCYLIHAETSAGGVAMACQAELAFTVA